MDKEARIKHLHGLVQNRLKLQTVIDNEINGYDLEIEQLVREISSETKEDEELIYQRLLKNS